MKPTATSVAPKSEERKKTTGPKKKSGYVSTEKTREELHKELLVLEIAKTKLEKRKLSREIIKFNFEIEVLKKTKRKKTKHHMGNPLLLPVLMHNTCHSRLIVRFHTKHTPATQLLRISVV